MSSSSSNRLGALDIAKCFAILLIVAGHTGIVFSSAATPGGMPPRLVSFAFTCHLPIFLVIAGYFFPEDRGLSRELIRKDTQRLLLPYAVTSILIILSCAVTAHSHGLGIKDELVRWSAATLWGAGSGSDVALWGATRIGGIWYLLATFWAHLLIASTNRLPRWQRLLVLCICAAGAVVSARHVWLPWSVQSGLGCAIFLYAGMMMRSEQGLERRLPWGVLAMLAGAWGYVILKDGGGSIAMQSYPLGAVTVIGGIASVPVVVAISRLIDERLPAVASPLRFVGQLTLPIFCLHIVEDNALYWGEIGVAMSSLTGQWKFTWLLVLALRFCVEAAMVGLAYLIPITREVYFPQLASRKDRHEAATGDGTTLAGKVA